MASIDITFCLNKDCPKHKTCHRFVRKPSKKQEVVCYGMFKPEEDGSCDSYWPIKKPEGK